MKNILSVFGRGAAVALFAGLSLVPASRAFAEGDDPAGAPNRPAVRVTAAEVDASNKKIAMAYGALSQMWTTSFNEIGERFVTPRLARYTQSAYTSCGVIHPSNAMYCPVNNTVYYDQVFVAGMGKIAAGSTGTDGDMASVGIIAHEVGHAVAMQLGHASRNSYENESTADCLAGAFAKQSEKDGSLEKGDIEEAFFGMQMAGDPTPEPTGNRRVDAMVQARLARESHGTKEQRMDNFKNGLERGPGACLSEFR
jgi:predicted metalloprotease